MCRLHPQPFSQIFVSKNNFNGPPFLRLSLRCRNSLPRTFTNFNKSHAIKSQTSAISRHGDPLTACTSKKKWIPTFLVQCGNTLFGALRKAFHISHPISLMKISNLVQSHVTATHSISNCQRWDSFDMTLFSAIFSICLHPFIHLLIPSTTCLCFLGCT